MFYLEEIKNKVQETAFIELPVRLYKDCPCWIRPLDQDIRNVFSPEKNPCFKHGECVRWLLRDEQGYMWGEWRRLSIGKPADWISTKSDRWAF